jgi:hypothetical protein
MTIYSVTNPDGTPVAPLFPLVGKLVTLHIDTSLGRTSRPGIIRESGQRSDYGTFVWVENVNEHGQRLEAQAWL